MTQNNWYSDTVCQVSKGGTGQSTYTDGQLLIGNTTGGTLTKGAPTAVANGGLQINSGSGTLSFQMISPYSLGDFTFTSATATTDRSVTISNTDNTAVASPAHLQVTVGGSTNTGDPYINFLVTGAGTMSIGLDNTDSDNFKITTGATPSAGTELIKMTSAGVITLANDLDVSEGGTGVSTLTSHGILLGNGAGDIQALAEASNGQIPIGSTGNNPVLATITAGVGISITNAAGSISIAATGGGMAYEEITDATKTIVVNYEYGANRGGGVAFTLPGTSAIGSQFKITGIAGLWSVVQGANQYVGFGNLTSTVGAGGSLTATNAGDCITCTCIVANLAWRVTASMGNVTIV